MNETHCCEDKDTLIDFLYGELDADRRRVFEGHVRTCVPCAMEIEELQSVRGELAEWLPPEADVDFTITPKSAPPATVLQPPRWSLTAVPAWARVAAAVFIVGAGLGLANVQVRSTADGVTISTGWMRSTPAEAPRAVQAAAVESTGAWRPELAALEADLRKEMQTLRATPPSAAPVTASRVSSGDDQAVMRRVQALLDASEKRQEQQVSRQLAAFGRDVEYQRRADYTNLAQGIDRFQTRSGAALTRHEQVLDLLVRASTSKVP